MKIVLCSIGKPHDTLLKQAIEDFTKRISNYFPVEWLLIAPPKNAGVLSIDDQKKTEATLFLPNLSKEDYLVLLDERGKNISSIELATFVQQRGNESTRKIIFLVGGAFGVHMIVRLVLAEQLYRACSIIRNEKYHHQ
jgi:23S rRNA (pseudouridine1915-N3)-methyltransferase